MQLPGLVSGFEPRPTVAIALSGGVDSMALVFLTRSWLEAIGGRMIALTVDHKFRPESSAEAAQIGKWMQALGIEHHTLTIQTPIEGNLQSQARKRRYQLLEDWCHAHGVLHLFTAHHADDVEETLAMRMWRGSGIEGLSAIPQIRYSANLRIVRPLLGMRKRALIEYLMAYNIPWIEDASNASDDYDRNIIRRKLAEYPLPAGQAEAFARQMAIARHHIDRSVSALLALSVECFADGTAIVDMRPWTGQSAHVILSALSRLSMFLTSAEEPPRYREVDQLWQQIKQPVSTAATLSGLLWERSLKKDQAHLWQLCREPARLQPMVWDTKKPVWWDRRFLMESSQPIGADLTLKPLGDTGLQRLKELRVPFPTHLTHAGKIGFLSIWQLDLLVGVPHINYWNMEAASQLSQRLRIRFVPVVPLAGSASRYPNV